jgi:hypothetical protein
MANGSCYFHKYSLLYANEDLPNKMLYKVAFEHI